jgi:Tol biopolymer transport system component
MMWQQITDNQYTDRDPVWSPEGNRLAFTSYQEFFDYLTDWLIVSSDEGTNQVPVAHGYSASWAPDGAKLVYGTGGGVAVVALPEAKEQVLTTNAAGWSSHPAWSPDGGLIAYVAGRAPAPGGFVDYELFTMRADGSGSQALVTDGSSLHPAWSPVTDEIAFFHRVDGLWGVFLVGADGANLRLIVTLGESIQWWSDLQLSGLAWSPDGEYIAFAADLDKNGHPDINVISRDGREAFRITDNSSFTRMSGLDWQ